MHFIRLLKRDSALLEGGHFTELLLYFCQLNLLTRIEVQKIQEVDSDNQVKFSLEVLEATNRHLDPHDFFYRVVDALRKATYTALANRLVAEVSLQEDYNVYQNVDGSGSISYPPDMPSNVPSSVDSGSSGVFSQASTNSFSSRSTAMLESYRQEYSKESMSIGALDSKVHDALVERAVTDLPMNLMRSSRYAGLLKNVWSSVAEYYTQASQAFYYLQMYGLSLLRYPWKHEIRKISTVSGVYRLRIAPHVTDAFLVLVDMGFEEQEDSSSFVLAGKIDRDRTMEAAFQCFLMVVHCRRMCHINARSSAYSSSMDSRASKSSRPSIGSSQTSASILSRDSGFSGESIYPNVSQRRDNRDSSREYRDNNAPNAYYNIGSARRLESITSATSSYYSSVSQDSMTRDPNGNRSQVSSSRSPSSRSSAAMSLLADEHSQPRSQPVQVDQASVDTITKFMNGIPDEGLSMLLCMPQASSSSGGGRQLGQSRGHASYSIPSPSPNAASSASTAAAATVKNVDKDFKETCI